MLMAGFLLGFYLFRAFTLGLLYIVLHALSVRCYGKTEVFTLFIRILIEGHHHRDDDETEREG